MTPDEALEMLRQMWQQVSATMAIHQKISQAFATLEVALHPTEVPHGETDGSSPQENPDQ